MSKQTKVVYIDDDEISVTMLKERLQEANMLFFSSPSTEACALIKNVKPDIIILDVVMPKINGFELCTIIKQDPELHDIPIIMLSSAASEENINKGAELGVVGFISKNVALDEFVYIVESHDALHEVKQSWFNTSKIMDKLLSKYNGPALKVS